MPKPVVADAGRIFLRNEEAVEVVHIVSLDEFGQREASAVIEHGQLRNPDFREALRAHLPRPERRVDRCERELMPHESIFVPKPDVIVTVVVMRFVEQSRLSEEDGLNLEKRVAVFPQRDERERAEEAEFIEEGAPV